MTEHEMPSHHGPGQLVGDGAYPNETMQLLLERGSCRTFEDRDIPADVLRTVLEAGVHAATGGNLQPYSIIQIQDPATRQALAEKCGQGFIARAPTSLESIRKLPCRAGYAHRQTEATRASSQLSCTTEYECCGV